MEYTIYCDESISKGRFYSDFYGGCLVRSIDQIPIIDALNQRKQELNLFGEIKWTKVTSNYLENYYIISLLNMHLDCGITRLPIKINLYFSDYILIDFPIAKRKMNYS